MENFAVLIENVVFCMVDLSKIIFVMFYYNLEPGKKSFIYLI